MSLHAQLSPEAEARLHAQRRNSTISAVIVSFLVLVLLGLILAFVLLDPFFKETPVIVSYSSTISDDDKIENKKMNTSIERKPSAPSSSMAKVIAANTSSPTAVPVPDIDVPEPSTDFGDGDDFGDGWGSGGDGGGGGGFGNIPASMSKRCSPEDRMSRLLESGGTEQCEVAVVKGLDWLQKTQNPDGSWGKSKKAAMTGLAVLAYLGHCETPLSEKYGETVLKGITYIVNVGVKKKGRLVDGNEPNPMPYEHAIATYALGESTTFCKQLGLNIPKLEEITQQAGQYIIDNQHTKSGGWDYGYAEDGKRGGDLSVTAWQIQALKACKHTGLDFRNMSGSIKNALQYVEECQNRDGGFDYLPGRKSHSPDGYSTLTGAGMLSFQMWEKENHAAVRQGAKYADKNAKFKYNEADCDLYGHYYLAQAMIARGGPEWKKYNDMIRDELLKNQGADGSWKKPGGGTKVNAVAAQFVNDAHYRNCLCILMLETYYRFLPGTGSH
ncbi:prenyltransferase/squalene oxidase repeat-containing protein [Haloferula chungangensis]|uniref:Prenyltransferase/squalene oxidase repeat-containing protein n=1 Tax=Haloferula chungangensis TaxID=1048331 RepID=A0ABW2L8V4_9BACT